MIHCGTLLQNATGIITKCDSCFIAKCHKSLFKNASDSLLQNATVIVNCNDFITKSGSYYKMQCLLQIATVQCGLKKVHLIQTKNGIMINVGVSVTK